MNKASGPFYKFKNLRFTIPFTIPGIAIFVITLVILVRSLSSRNAYEIVLSLSALALWSVLWLSGKWAVRRLANLEPQWKIPSPMGASSCEEWLVSSPGARVPRFFRLHFLVSGRFFLQGSHEACSVSAETSLPRKSAMADGNTAGNNCASLSINFPMGGLFRGETSCRLRDVFGFFSFQCGNSRERSIVIRNAPCGAKALRIDAQSGAEDRRNKNANDEERYYMREYSPGDRFRDINWKSSGRIDTLITRISPDNQERITRIEVYFRNYGPSRHGLSIVDLWLLDRAKARLSWFLRKVKEEKSSYVFNVRSAGRSWDLNDDDEIEAFLEELAALPFLLPQNEKSSLPKAEGEIYVFSTSCDTALPAFLLTQQGRPLSLFLAQNAPRDKASRKSIRPEASESLLLRDFTTGSFVPLPCWLMPGRKQLLKVSASRLMIDYAETRL